MDNIVKYRIEINNGIITVVKDYYRGNDVISKGVYDRSYTYNSTDRVDFLKKAASALYWADIRNGEKWNLGADVSKMYSVCDLYRCCPVEKGEDLECSMVCGKYNCGAIETMCPLCRARYFSTPGCGRQMHNSPTKCQCSIDKNKFPTKQ